MNSEHLRIRVSGHLRLCCVLSCRRTASLRLIYLLSSAVRACDTPFLPRDPRTPLRFTLKSHILTARSSPRFTAGIYLLSFHTPLATYLPPERARAARNPPWITTGTTPSCTTSSSRRREMPGSVPQRTTSPPVSR